VSFLDSGVDFKILVAKLSKAIGINNIDLNPCVHEFDTGMSSTMDPTSRGGSPPSPLDPKAMSFQAMVSSLTKSRNFNQLTS
jgi:hypothetical protein